MYSLVKPFISGFDYLYEWIKIFLPDVIVRKMSNFFHIANRDMRYLVKARIAVNRAKKFKVDNLTLIDSFKATLIRQPDKVCFIFEDSRWTFRDVEIYSNCVCSTVGSKLSKGDVVILLLPNRAEYACTWLGLAKAGVITALVNTNLKMKPLLHCINATKPKAIIYSNQFDTALSDIKDNIEGDPTFYCFEGKSLIDNSINFPKELATGDRNFQCDREVNVSDVVLYIFTSGTTGLPKPAIVTHFKLMVTNLSSEISVGVVEEDVVYAAMPMYHSSATVTVVASFVIGLTSIFRTKFSASAFIHDCRKYNVTVLQYIGEMLRYILATNEQEGEKEHKLRFITGNGIRADVWRKFSRRFNIPQIIEYYGSTEGNFLLVNNQNLVGSCGYLPIGIPRYHLLGPSLLKMNQETGQPLRNKYGHCMLAEPGETGLLIGFCPAGNDMRDFLGYLNKDDTASKFIFNVFKKGDRAFNTGDLLVMDERGWLTFQDRFGDTFRWKGENVSTTEVENVLKGSPDVADCAVYGVQVGNLEGKAGMAAAIMKNLNLDNFSRYLDLSLPSYAQPLFLRLVDSLEYTSTYKVVKTQLKKQSYDISAVKDPLLIKLDGKYVNITTEIYQQILNGSLKL